MVSCGRVACVVCALSDVSRDRVLAMSAGNSANVDLGHKEFGWGHLLTWLFLGTCPDNALLELGGTLVWLVRFRHCLRNGRIRKQTPWPNLQNTACLYMD